MTAMRAVTYRAGMSTSALARSVVDAAWRSPGRLRRPWLVEVAVMLVLTIFAVFGTTEAVQQGDNGSRQLDWLGWGLLAVAVLAFTGRRHWPAVVLLVTTAAIAISVALGYPTGPIWATPLIALYSTAATGRRRLALLGGGALAAVPLVKGVSAPTYPGGRDPSAARADQTATGMPTSKPLHWMRGSHRARAGTSSSRRRFPAARPSRNMTSADGP
jgi:hypothetical protein